MALYVLTTLAYMYMLSIDQMKNAPLVATEALSAVLGNKGAVIIALLVMISTAGAVNGNVLPCARINYAMAKDKVFFLWADKVDSRFKTPYGALWLQCFWACLFVMSGSFDMLSDMFVFVTWIFYGFAAYGIFILRKKIPHAERPFRLKAYPWSPLIFIFFALFYFVITIYNDINNYLSGKTEIIFSLLGLALLAAGVPFYWFFKKRKNQ
jgi:APA family basic amino acid/polyamine antiporter